MTEHDDEFTVLDALLCVAIGVLIAFGLTWAGW